jgi:RNA polymerase subunit RPABC4/transcription elongation factor Spt4
MALIDPNDVRRLFQGLVQVLAEGDPGRLQAPFQVAELYQQIIPYRAHRARLGFDSNQDYEAAVLGLLAGVGGFATVEPVEAQESLAAEAAFPNPDPGLFREFAGARVRLNPARVRELLDRPAAYAPPEPEPDPEPAPAPADPDRPPAFLLERDGPKPPAAADAGLCRGCGQALPGDRAVVFCPWCGQAVGVPACPRCGDDLETGWRFCPRCGTERRG